MKKTLALFVVLAIVVTSLVCFAGCDTFKKWFGNDLEKDGYKFNEETNWYEKEGDPDQDGSDADGTFINFTESGSEIGQTYVVGPVQNRVVFIGNSSMVYSNFDIKVEGRYSSVYIELRNMKFVAPTGSAGIDASDVNPDFTVYIIVSGTSAVTGGNGDNGEDGKSYGINTAASNPRSGVQGADGQNGSSAIIGNTIYLTTNQSSTLILTGGNGGNGGRGGDGEGAAQKEIGQAGHGANGGNGGLGGSGLEATKSLSVENNGIITATGGVGGNGGNGGHGGHNKNTGAFDRADHAGHGGSGGNGGNGGYGIKVGDGGTVRVNANFANMYGGRGGNGGNGNDGGNSTKCEFQTSNGGNPGNAGNGGNGGNGGASAYNIDSALYSAHPGEGGTGGTKGNPGRNPSIGYGKAGVDGTPGESGRS